MTLYILILNRAKDAHYYLAFNIQVLSEATDAQYYLIFYNLILNTISAKYNQSSLKQSPVAMECWSLTAGGSLSRVL